MIKYVIFISICLVSCNSGKPAGEHENTEPAIQESAGLPAGFSASFGTILESYYTLRDALVAGDVAASDKAAAQLISASEALNLGDLKPSDPDNLIIPTAQTYVSGIESESKGLTGEEDIESRRKAFQMITANLYDLSRTVRYDGDKIYLLHCPMAFNNAGADWLSATTDINNPYFGSKMLKCGFVKDSVRVAIN